MGWQSHANLIHTAHMGACGIEQNRTQYEEHNKGGSSLEFSWDNGASRVQCLMNLGKEVLQDSTERMLHRNENVS